MPGPRDNSRLVYSTDGGRTRPSGEPPRPRPARPPSPPTDPDDGIVRLRRVKAGRAGKTVTTIAGLPGSEADLDALLKSLKQHCGAGGVRQGRILEIQGDHRERLQARLESLGYRARLAGG